MESFLCRSFNYKDNLSFYVYIINKSYHSTIHDVIFICKKYQKSGIKDPPCRENFSLQGGKCDFSVVKGLTDGIQKFPVMILRKFPDSNASQIHEFH